MMMTLLRDPKPPFGCSSQMLQFPAMFPTMLTRLIENYYYCEYIGGVWQK